MATFSDKSPAGVTAFHGKGHATYFGFHPGLAYMQPALPRRPVDRTPSFEGFTHFVPTRFSLAVRELLLGLVKDVPNARPIISSNPLVRHPCNLGFPLKRTLDQALPILRRLRLGMSLHPLGRRSRS